MTDSPTDSKSRTRRKRRGHSDGLTPPTRVIQGRDESQPLDPATFQNVDKMVGVFAQKHFGNAFPQLARSFFNIATPAERDTRELQMAFSLWVVYGWRDKEGRRIVDMFAKHAIALAGEQTRVLNALLRAKFSVFHMRRSEQANEQLRGRDALRNEPMIIRDHAAFNQIKAGDGLVSWFFPVGRLWRPLGVATRVPSARVKALQNALHGFKQGRETKDQTLLRMADTQPAQVFWTCYRGANFQLKR